MVASTLLTCGDHQALPNWTKLTHSNLFDTANLLTILSKKMPRSFGKQLIRSTYRLSRGSRSTSLNQGDERNERKKDTLPKFVTLDDMYIVYHQKKERFFMRRNAIIGAHA